MSRTLRIEHHPILEQSTTAQEVAIAVDGQEIPAIEGEPVAAALLAAGIRKVRTMPDTGAPRGVFTGVGRSIEELGTVDGEANLPLMSTRVTAGMSVTTQQGLGDWGDAG
ncbi:(2Fe-2S)-binding protein [soil metagenome]